MEPVFSIQLVSIILFVSLAKHVQLSLLHVILAKETSYINKSPVAQRRTKQIVNKSEKVG